MRRHACVVDASAVVAILFREPGFANVLAAVPDGATLIAPPLLPMEVANVARVKVRRRELTRADAEAVLANLSRLRVRQLNVRWRSAWTLAWAHDLTVYDAAYLHVALARDARLLTLDGALHAAAGRRALP